MARSETSRKSKTGTPLPEIPNKLYFRIGEVARLLALPPYVLRFWETEFPHLKPGKGGTGQRLYRQRDVEALVEIRRLLYDEGYTIPGARQLLKEKARSPEPALPLQPDALEQTSPTTGMKLRQLHGELREIAALLARPVANLSITNPAHRGLHLTARRRNAPNLAPPLFAFTEDEPGGDT